MPTPLDRTLYNRSKWSAAGRCNTSASDGWPKYGKGFWHGYAYVPDPTSPSDNTKYHVKCHAGFLDGHAAAIELNWYTSIDRDGHLYY